MVNKRLTQREVDAIIEALTARLADEMDGDDLQTVEVYESALNKMRQRLKENR
jgi:hypothetical protein